MTSFHKLLSRFLGQFEESYEPSINSKSLSHSNVSTFQRSRSLSKVISTRRQRSFEAFKNASCLSCGFNEPDQQLSKNNDQNTSAISSKDQCSLDKKASFNQNKENSPQQQLNKQKRRMKTKLIVIRHGERIDALFGDSWLPLAFDRVGNYRRFHTNLPISLPYRKNYHDYRYDPPLTQLGLIRSYRTGEELYRAGLRIDHCYSSPSLRCIQTADAILDGMKLRTLIPIRIELGLFECGIWHKGVIPQFMSINELVLNRLNIETSYRSIQKALSTDENEHEYYERSHSIMRQILLKHNSNDSGILFVGHAPSLETLTRQLTGAQPRPDELTQIAQKINYLSLTILEGQRDSWAFVDTTLAKQS